MWNELSEADLEYIEKRLGYSLDYYSTLEAMRLDRLGASLDQIATELKYGGY